MKEIIALVAVLATATQANNLIKANTAVQEDTGGFGHYAYIPGEDLATVVTSRVPMMITLSPRSTTVAHAKAAKSQPLCEAKCGKDSDCIAECRGEPHWGPEEMTRAQVCIANCKQGSGSAAENAAYLQCHNDCESSNLRVKNKAPDASRVVEKQAGDAAVEKEKAETEVAAAATTETADTSSVMRKANDVAKASAATVALEVDDDDDGDDNDDNADVSTASATATIHAAAAADAVPASVVTRRGAGAVTTSASAMAKSSNAAATAQVGLAGLVALAGFVLS